ncbi:MAG TPA: hypothetical protein VKF35_24175 [Hyphomicrobiaceae bacterium]|nr:hypothetical protein [Hyphomicrobiaceae bacterium]
MSKKKSERRCHAARDQHFKGGERKRSATAVGFNLVGAFFALRSLDTAYAGMVLQVWDEQVAGDNVCMSPPDATRPPAHARKAARLIREALEIFSERASE